MFVNLQVHSFCEICSSDDIFAANVFEMECDTNCHGTSHLFSLIPPQKKRLFLLSPASPTPNQSKMNSKSLFFTFRIPFVSYISFVITIFFNIHFWRKFNFLNLCIDKKSVTVFFVFT